MSHAKLPTALSCAPLLPPRAKKEVLTAEQIRLIRSEAQYTSQYKLAKKYGCSRSNIAQIVRRNSWRHIEDSGS